MVVCIGISRGCRFRGGSADPEKGGKEVREVERQGKLVTGVRLWCET